MNQASGRLGPIASERLERFFDGIERMSDAELAMLRGVWDEEDETDRTMAWRHVRRIIKERGRSSTLDAAQARLAAWVNNYMPSGFYGGITHTSGLNQGQIRHLALPPLLDAVAAIVTSDELDPAEQTLLLEPMTRLLPNRQ